nr:hypothetical protein [Tanacetum cinerariifolium]
YCSQSRAYRLYNPTSKTIIVSRDVVFSEQAYWDWKNKFQPSNSQIVEEEKTKTTNTDEFSPIALQKSAQTTSPTSSLETSLEGSPLTEPVSTHLRRIKRGSLFSLISEFKQTMMNKFDMTNLRELNYFLGLEIKQTSTGIFMSQKKYVKDTINKFNMIGCKYVPTPMNIGEKLWLNDSKWEFIQSDSVADRKAHLVVVSYILGTTVVSWSLKKQATVALSTTEAEYVAVTASACQAVWLR